jgi:CheY-like chemotaxis protein
LIVEDDVDVAEALALILEDAGYVTEIASNGAEGLDRLRRGPPPELILLDLMMPVMGGCEFRREQVRMEDVASIPVVVLSADAQAARKAAEMECTDCVTKPVELDRLLDLVRRYCGQRSTSAS